MHPDSFKYRSKRSFRECKLCQKKWHSLSRFPFVARRGGHEIIYLNYAENDYLRRRRALARAQLVGPALLKHTRKHCDEPNVNIFTQQMRHLWVRIYVVPPRNMLRVIYFFQRSTNAPRAFDIIQLLVSSYLNEQRGKDTNDFIYTQRSFFCIDLLFLVHGWLPVVKHFTPAHKEPLSET